MVQRSGHDQERDAGFLSPHLSVLEFGPAQRSGVFFVRSNMATRRTSRPVSVGPLDALSESRSGPVSRSPSASSPSLGQSEREVSKRSVPSGGRRIVRDAEELGVFRTRRVSHVR